MHRVVEAIESRIVTIFVVLAAGSLAVIAWLYFHLATTGEPSRNSADWVSFAAYFGGVAGPLLTFYTVAGLLGSLALQRESNARMERSMLAEHHIRMLMELSRDLEAIEQQRITSEITFRDLLDQPELCTSTARNAVKPVIAGYVKTLGLYSEAISLYRDNVTAHFDARAFEQRARRWHERVSHLGAYLGFNDQIALAFIHGHIENTLNPTECEGV